MHDEPSRGVGSIDYIHGLLIAEDDLDSDENESTNFQLPQSFKTFNFNEIDTLLTGLFSANKLQKKLQF